MTDITYYETDSEGKIIGASTSPFTPQPGNILQTHSGKIFRGADGEIHKDTERATPQRIEDFGWSPLVNFDKKSAPTKEVIVTAPEDEWLFFRHTSYYDGYLTLYPCYPSTSETPIQGYSIMNEHNCTVTFYIPKNSRYKVTGNCGVDLFTGGL